MFKVIYYHFTPKEVLALYKFFRKEYINPKKEELMEAVTHICKIVDSHEFPNRNNQAT